MEEFTLSLSSLFSNNRVYMPNYAPRVSLSYEDLSGVISLWSEVSETVVVYQHAADEEVNTTHVHMILINCKFSTPEALKRIFYANYKTERKGNDLWSWTHKGFPTPDLSFIGYMAKEDLRPVYTKNISPAQVEEQRVKWSKPTPKAPLRQSSIHESNNQKKLTKNALLAQVVNHILTVSNATGECENRKQAILIDASEVQVIKAIRKVLIENDQVIGLYKVLDLYDGFVMYHQKETFLSNCLQVLEKRKPRV